MSFQAYLDSIQKKTGKSPDELKQIATQKGFLLNGEITATTKAGDIVKWLKDDFDLGQGHAMAVYALFKGIRKEGD